MTRKSAIVTLCILGAVSFGACCCCTWSMDDENRDPAHHGGHGGGWHSTTHYIWFGGWSHSSGPTGGASGIASSRGGFGATGAGHGGGE